MIDDAPDHEHDHARALGVNPVVAIATGSIRRTAAGRACLDMLLDLDPDLDIDAETLASWTRQVLVARAGSEFVVRQRGMWVQASDVASLVATSS